MRTRPAKRKAQHRVPDEVLGLRDQYVTAAGQPESATVEHDPDPRKNDHVWINIQAGKFGRIQIALSTLSRQSRAAGFDPRVSIGIFRSSWSELPPAGVFPTAGLDYALLEADSFVEFKALEREALEQLLVAKTQRAIFVEVWGEFYIRAHIGVHQVHSRRASFAVARDFIGRDGAVQFYFEQPNEREMLLFKFAGQP